MLTELRITNFAVVDQLSLRFSKGFTVLTGETGAGKSILIDALSLLIGGRASADQIRSGAEEAQLQAAFSLPYSSPLLTRLRSQDLLGQVEHELIIRRVLNKSGRSRVYINGSLTALRTIEELAGRLVDIHGQHDQQSLLSPEAQLEAVDAFGHLIPLRDDYRQTRERWKTCRQELEERRRLSGERFQREDFLRFQYQEIEAAGVQPGEEERLQGEYRRLSHARRLTELSHSAYGQVYEGDQAVLNALSSVRKNVHELLVIDPEAKELGTLCDEALIQLKELAGRLREYRDHVEQDPDRLVDVEQRLDLLQRLKKKYGGTMEAVLVTAEQLKSQLDDLEDSEQRLAELEKELTSHGQQMETRAAELSKKRVQAARRMTALVTEQLAGLRMGRTQFEVSVRTEAGEDSFGLSGCDRVECLLSANQGEPLQPLSRVASGGEVSRVMLALKTVLAETDGVPVLIFDEVDSGVGGAVAAVMGTRLKDLAAYHQVLCVTHLPQVASQADQHVLVEKKLKQSRTVTSVRMLDDGGRHEEIARMLGGVTITQKVRETAAEMIAGSKGRG